LVNKFIRNRIVTQERALPFEEAKLQEENARKAQETDYDDATFNLLFKDELQERELARILLEYGTKPWNDTQLVADHIFSEMIDESLLDNPDIIRLINTFKEQIRAAPQQVDKNYFVYHPDAKVSSLAVSLLNFPYEESDHWRKEYSQATGYQKQLFEQTYEQFIKTVARGNDQQLMKYLKMDEDKTRFEVESALGYLKLKKIQRLMMENQVDMEKTHSNEEKEILSHTQEHLKRMEADLIKTHQHIKELQKTVTDTMGTVILR